MSRMYALYRRVASRWIWLMLALVLATFSCGMIGFSYGDPHHWSTDLYLTALLFMLNSGDVAKDVNLSLNVARWLGLATWFMTVAAVLIRLFSIRVLEWFVWWTAKNHIIVAGLGRHGEELIARLRQRGENVIVLSTETKTTQLDTCRDLGAVVFVGNPAMPHLLKRACLNRAKRLLVLFDDDQATLQVVTEAFQMLQPDSPQDVTPTKRVRCVAKVSEPGLQEVINQHDLHRKKSDFFSISTINLYELSARSMLSRARWHSVSGTVRRLAILGLGEHTRLAETLILRAAKDQLIDQSERLEIHLYDHGAEQFAKELLVRFPFIVNACDLHSHSCSSGRCGIGCDDPELGISDDSFDAAFVCIEDESRAAVQAVKLGKLLKSAPVIVRSEDSRNGLGALLQLPDAGGLGKNILTVGFQDLILDLAIVSNPKRELVAQASHEGYLATHRTQIAEAEEIGDSAKASDLRNKPANVPWECLSSSDRDSNRALYYFYTQHLRLTHPQHKPISYQIRERLSGHVGENLEDLLHFSTDEIEYLAEQEHDRWVKFKAATGWSYAPVRNDARKHHPCMVPYDQLDETTKDLDREIFRQLPRVLAKANFVIRPAQCDYFDQDET